MMGLKFFVKAIHSDPYVIVQQDNSIKKQNVFKGVYIEIWNTLAAKMNFSSEVTQAPDTIG